MRLYPPTVSSTIVCECDLDVIDVDQCFVQSDLDKDIFLRLLKECGDLSSKVVRLNKRLYRLKQASRTYVACPPDNISEEFGIGTTPDVYGFHSIEDGRVANPAVVYIEDIFAVGRNGGVTEPSRHTGRWGIILRRIFRGTGIRFL